MKKLLSICLAIAVMCSLCACEQLDKLRSVKLPELPDTEATAEPTATPEPSAEPEPEATEIPAEDPGDPVVIRMETYSETKTAPDDDEQVILNFSYETPVISIEGNSAATEAINDVFSMADDAWYTGSEYHGTTAVGFNIMLEDAEENYYLNRDGQLETNLTYECTRTAEIDRADANAIVIRLITYMYTGVGEGNSYTEEYIFDTRTGALLTTEDLSKDEYQAPVCAESATAEPEICFTNDLPSGTVIFDMLNAGEAAEDLSVWFPTIAYNVRVSSVEYSDIFYETGTLWFCSYMDGNALELLTMIPDGMPNLMISFENAAGETTRLLITESGENGQPILTGDDISAVG